MEIYKVQSLVIGAGVVGLAVARELSRAGHEVLVLEKNNSFGAEISSRNSEVIHAGLYYPNPSLKAALCVSGREMLYQYCMDNSIDYKKCGKLVVATSPAQKEALSLIHKSAIKNGCHNVSIVSESEVSELEPDIKAVSALLSPETGVIDSHAYMTQLLADVERGGGQCIFNTIANIAKVDSKGISVEADGGDSLLIAQNVFNCAGLSALKVIDKIVPSLRSVMPALMYAKGSYFAYSGKHSFERLIYPVPEPGGLGVHLTLDLGGKIRFGPDVEWLDCDSVDDDHYEVSPSKRQKFYDAIKDYWPSVDLERLVPDYAGIRPKLSGPNESAADFRIEGVRDHGIKGLVNLFGIESPGLTASLAIAKYALSQL